MYWAIVAVLLLMATIAGVTMYATSAVMQQAQQNVAEYGAKEIAAVQKCGDLTLKYKDGKLYIKGEVVDDKKGHDKDGHEDEYELEDGVKYKVGSCIVVPQGGRLYVLVSK